jgi:inhibitor of KinA sporulation pathway (predicted exonuclease)
MASVQQYVFFDFEMLCSNRGMPFSEMEAIRLGAVKYDLESEQISYFDRFIQPKNRKPLSKFCKQLTGIKDEDLVNASDFKEVFGDFLTWIGGVKRSRFFSWSPSDLSRLKIDTEKHAVPATTIKKIEKRYVDFQAIFTKRVSKTNHSVENALQLYDLSFVGEKHHPMYDALNTLRIYLRFLHEPVTSDIIMVKQFMLDDVPKDKLHLNKKISSQFKKDIHAYLQELHAMYRMKDAAKVIKRTRRLVEKYENILINRSSLFSKENVKSIGLFVDFYHDLLMCYDEHLVYSSKVMILDEHMVKPIDLLLLKLG